MINGLVATEDAAAVAAAVHKARAGYTANKQRTYHYRIT
jgi:hypothetical protein